MKRVDRQLRLNEAIKYLISIGLIDAKTPTKSIAQTMRRHPTNISAVRNGDERYMSKKFTKNFCALYNNIISEEWLWSGEGSMIAKEPTDEEELCEIGSIPVDALNNMGREELILIIKQMEMLNKEQYEIHQLYIQQNKQMVESIRSRINNIVSVLCGSKEDEELKEDMVEEVVVEEEKKEKKASKSKTTKKAKKE